MPTAASRRLYVPQSAEVARTMLGALRRAHQDLIVQMAAMDELTFGQTADLDACATARWRLSQASLARRLLAARICDYFQSRVEADCQSELKSLAEADQALLRESTAHLGRWSIATIGAEWPGYCEASRAIRRKTHVHIVLEQKLLYPMLESGSRLAA